MPQRVTVVTDGTFESEVLRSELPVLVDFSASWCAPCRSLGAVLEEVSGQWEGRLKVMRLDVDENPEAPSRLGVQTLPAMLLFVSGSPVVRHLGSADQNKVEALLQARLGA